MKIVQKTSSLMILKQNSITTTLFGVVFAAIGIWSIVISTQNKAFAIFIGIIFVIAGLFTTLASRSVSIQLNKLNSFTDITISSLINRKHQRLPFNQIKVIAIEASVQGSNNFLARNQYRYNLVFYTNQNDSVLIPLDTNSSGLIIMGYQMLTHSKERAIELGNAIATFINVPFIYRDPPTINDLVTLLSQQSVPKPQIQTSTSDDVTSDFLKTYAPLLAVTCLS